MRRACLAVLGGNLVLVGADAVTYRPFFNQPGSVVYLIEPVVLLVAYAVVVLTVPRSVNADQPRVLRTAVLVGLATGALEIVNITGETFTGLSGAANVVATAPFILGPFVIWGVVGGWAAWVTGALRLGMLGAVCSAMVTMVVGVTFGFVLTLAAPSRLERILATDPDFVRSGWTDVKAFVLANAFDNGFTHLLGALVVGSVMGLIGSMVGVRAPRARVAP